MARVQGDFVGSEPQVVSHAGYRLARDEDYVYATDSVDGEIWAVPVEGGEAILLAESLVDPFHIAIDRTHVDWTRTTDALSMPNPLR